MARYLDEEGLNLLWSKIVKEDDKTKKLIYEAHCVATASASPMVIEQGVNTSVTIKGRGYMNGVSEVAPKKLVINNIDKGSTNVEQNVAAQINTSTTFNVTAKFDHDVEKTASVEVKAYYPIVRFCAGDEDNIRSFIETYTSSPANADMKSIKANAAGAYNYYALAGERTYLCVPEGVVVPTKATLNGFTYNIDIGEMYLECRVNGAMVNYIIIRGTNAIANTEDFTVIYS